MAKILATLKIPPEQESFTHKDDDGTYRTFMIGTMTEFVKEWPNCKDLIHYKMPIDKMTAKHIRKNMGIENDRLRRLKHPYLSAPGIAILWPNKKDLTIVDGNHRYVKRHKKGLKFMNVHVFLFPFWENFLLPKEAQERLITERNPLENPSRVLEWEKRKLLKGE